MMRLIAATRNSLRALQVLARHEKAVQQEFILLGGGIVLGMLIAPTLSRYALLVGVLVFLLIIEIINTAIEATCDALTKEFDKNIQLAKDCGSLAVGLSLLVAAVVWGWAIWAWFLGF